MHLQKLAVDYPSIHFQTQLFLGSEILHSPAILNRLKGIKRPLVLIADQQIAPLFAIPFVDHLKKNGLDITLIQFEATEALKTQEKKQEIENTLFSARFGKEIAIIAMGGGVTTDLIGYLASTFCRGVPLFLIPTTLLAMVDASLGGKTGVNTPFGKNLVGTFYPAKEVFIDISLLKTLPERQYRSAFAEIIKHGLIASSDLFYTLLEQKTRWDLRDPLFLEEIIYKSLLIKKEVVTADFLETGYRRTLNFGHTFGHAIELLENYQISHGEAVAIGMLAEAMLSYEMGYLRQDEFDEIEKILKCYQFDFALSEEFNADELIQAMVLDKKSHIPNASEKWDFRLKPFFRHVGYKQEPRFVLLNGIGSTHPFDGAYCTTIDPLVLKETIHNLFSHLQRRSHEPVLH